MGDQAPIVRGGYELARTGYIILAVGRFVQKKGFDHLIEACAVLKRDGIRFHCIIVGERGDAYDGICAQIDSSFRLRG